MLMKHLSMKISHSVKLSSSFTKMITVWYSFYRLLLASGACFEFPNTNLSAVQLVTAGGTHVAFCVHNKGAKFEKISLYNFQL